MSPIIFPIVGAYFLIGWLFTVNDLDPSHDDVDMIMYFLFWPVILVYLIVYWFSYIIFYIVKKVLIIIRNIYRLIKKSIEKKRRISF